jgi:hypothetical protein
MRVKVFIMKTIIASEKVGNLTVNILPDAGPMNPRTECDNLCVMVCFHGRYTLGDKDHGYKESNFNGWDALEAEIWKKEDPAVVLPLYMYDHSGLTIATHPFACPWDSGQIGFIFARKADIRKAYDVKRITKKVREQVEKLMLAEVEEYDSYVRGECYYWQIEDENENILESGGGCLGDWEKNGLLQEGINMANSILKNMEKNRLEANDALQMKLPL